MSVFLPDLQAKLQYRFENPKLLQQALTHRSFSATHNERLEFLGDSVLNLSITELLYLRLSHAPEGDLSRIRANLVREESLHKIALQIGVAEFLQLGEGESHSGGRKRPSILADAVESVIGAVYLDGGFAPAKALVHRLFEGVDLSAHANATAKDGKTALQEFLQARKIALPVYTVERIDGADHAQIFEVACSVQKFNLTTNGQGVSRRAAEQAAAQAMMQVLQEGKHG